MLPKASPCLDCKNTVFVVLFNWPPMENSTWPVASRLFESGPLLWVIAFGYKENNSNVTSNVCINTCIMVLDYINYKLIWLLYFLDILCYAWAHSEVSGRKNVMRWGAVSRDKSAWHQPIELCVYVSHKRGSRPSVWSTHTHKHMYTCMQKVSLKLTSVIFVFIRAVKWEDF